MSRRPRRLPVARAGRRTVAAFWLTWMIQPDADGSVKDTANGQLSRRRTVN